jgi:hypothetical protein
MRLTTIVINDILLPVLLYLFFLCVRVHVCMAFFSAWRASDGRRWPGQQVQVMVVAAEKLATALSATTCPAFSIWPGRITGGAASDSRAWSARR